MTSAAVGRACGAAACGRVARQLAGASDHAAAPTQRRTTGPQTQAQAPYLPIGYCWQVAENRGVRWYSTYASNRPAKARCRRFFWSELALATVNGYCRSVVQYYHLDLLPPRLDSRFAEMEDGDDKGRYSVASCGTFFFFERRVFCPHRVDVAFVMRGRPFCADLGRFGPRDTCLRLG